MMSLIKSIWVNQHHRFLIVGAYNTGFGYLSFVALYALLGSYIHYLVIVVLSHVLAVSNAFMTQRMLVFRGKGSVLAEFIRFNITTVGTLLLGLVGMAILVEQAKLHVYLAQAMVTSTTVIVTYFAHKHFTFKKHNLDGSIGKLPDMVIGAITADISRKATQGLQWIFLLRLVAQLATLGMGVLVIRYVKPEEYGLKAMAEISLALLFFLGSGGAASAISKGKELNNHTLRQALGLFLVASMVLCGVQWMAAYPLAEYYNEPRIQLLAQIMAVGLLLAPWNSIPAALLGRETSGKAISTISLSANALGALAALLLAMMGFGVWALVAGSLLAVLLNALMLNIYRPGCFLPSFSWGGLRGMIRFEKMIFLAGLSGLVLYKADVFIAGRFMVPREVGLYAVACYLASLPMHKVMPVAQRLAFPAASAMRDSHDCAAECFLKAVRLASLVLLPISFGLAGMARYFVPAVLGEEWVEITQTLAVLCVAFPIIGMNMLCMPIENALGKPNLGLRYSVLAVVAMIPALLYGVRCGGLGLALAWLFVFPWAMLLNTLSVLKLVNASFLAYVRAMLPPLFVSSVMLAGLQCFASTGMIIQNVWITLGVMVFAGAFVYLGGMFVLSKQRLFEWYEMRQSI